MFNIVLVEPEIPYNTGNIARTCAATGSTLHLVKPLGFSTEDKYLKRAGLDYWDKVRVIYHENFQELREKYPEGRFFYLSTKGKRYYHEVSYKPGDFLVFGKETQGLPQELLEANKEFTFRIPMLPQIRSLNLSNTVAIVVYEALRQLQFPDFV
ncbi:tRNA (uridine(34)/cytosine(34)/5-carboxymethylaminomethyluridine(34)-2'-O)-methyltransferase TrmL [Carboxydothermus hydrogenoformans]|uniref:Putative tRNA (cytidine(34)-2'-O)-methyltransferase n=1 Tax=Carboxydothermus hydrogenoformans (strain ATCC BAA-161 / DSM 6008 / Z-2901) TaxID=246194 RepID=Q3AD16_CARHZ|nr:tRNA (uridine(34)/cytosine(34)/5-carboxymethylaminomethyluridine(34)-2'-O)-methyltransferase TrmL [Carboxydothermus hydrogenoformans]ABB15928.1 RNA methyltransferase, TrmH family, group 2 [Carboxydothermus hydrogenoformans Z-2901]